MVDRTTCHSMYRALTHAAGGPSLTPPGTASSPHLLTHTHTHKHRGMCNHSGPVDTGEASDQASSKSREETQGQCHLAAQQMFSSFGRSSLASFTCKDILLFIHLFLAVRGLRCCMGFSLAAASRCCSLAAQISHCRSLLLHSAGCRA